MTDAQRESELLYITAALDTKMNGLIREYLYELNRHKGKKCLRCGTIQGAPKNGFHEYFCDHLEQHIKRKQREQENEIVKEFILLVQQRVSPRVLDEQSLFD